MQKIEWKNNEAPALSAENLNLMQDNIEQAIEDSTSPGAYVGPEEPTDPNTNLWIRPNEPLNNIGTEVVDSLEGNETNMAPSVRAVNNHLIGTTLWENPHIASSFGSQTINLDLSNYEFVGIEYCYNSGNTNIRKFDKFIVGYISTLMWVGGTQLQSRNITLNSSSIVFADNKLGDTTTNTGLIPIKIVGYK